MFSCLAFVFYFLFYKNKDFGCALCHSSKSVFFKGYCELMFLRTWTKEPYCKKLALSLANFCHSAGLKNSPISQFPLVNIARNCKNLLVPGLLEVNDLA